MSQKISQMTAAGTLTGTEQIEVSQLSTTVTITAATLSAQASDNSYNDSGSGFVTAGFAVSDTVKVTGFTGDVANNIFSATVTAVTAGKLTIGGADGDVIVDDAAGESVTITKWNSRRTTLAGAGAVATDAIWDAAGDLAVGTGANTAAKLSIGSALQVLRVNAAGTALEWAAASGGSSVTTIISTVSKTRPADTTTYTIDDTVSESTSAGTVWTFANMASANGLGGILQGVGLIISTAQTLKFDGELWLFDTAPATALNDNVAWAPTDAELKTKVAIVSLSGGAWRTGSGNGSIEMPGLAIGYQCAAGSTSLFGVLRAKNGYVPTSAEEFTIRLSAVQG